MTRDPRYNQVPNADYARFKSATADVVTLVTHTKMTIIFLICKITNDSTTTTKQLETNDLRLPVIEQKRTIPFNR